MPWFGFRSIRPVNDKPATLEPLEPRVLFSGDTMPDIQAVYPADAFLSDSNPNARVIDITRLSDISAIIGPDATPDDAADDDSRAFIAALDFIKSKQINDPRLVERLATGNGNISTRSPDTSYVIYVPQGTFHVENTIEYSGSTFDYWVQMRIVGESRSESVIRLKNARFDNGERRAVIDFTQNAGDDPTADGFNNWPAQNVLRNLTINTGNNNPDAVGVDFFGANNAEIHNITIRSNDRQGEIGLHIPIGMTSGYYSDITIDGFDRGILIEPYHFANPTLENITLRNQNEAGIRVVNSNPAIRLLRSTNTVPALELTDGGAHVVITDSRLTGGAPGNAAIVVDDSGKDRDPNPIAVNDPQQPFLSVGHLFARDVEVDGYGSAVEKDGSVAVSGTFIDEYVSDDPIGFDADQRLRSLNLPVRESPDVPWTSDLSFWVSPDDYGAVGDGVANDTAAVQDAFNDPNARIVYFPSKAYNIESAISVPDHVDRVDFMFTTLVGAPSGSYFSVNQDAVTPLVMHDLYDAAGEQLVSHDQPRDLVLQTIRSDNLYRNTSSGARGDLFLNNANGYGKNEDARAINQNVYARFINTEFKNGSNFRVGDGGMMWVLGYKGEGGAVNFDVDPGGTLEILGGHANQYGSGWNDSGPNTSPDITIINDGGNVSAILTSSGRNNSTVFFDEVIVDTQDGITKTVFSEPDPQDPNRVSLPDREGRLTEFIVPLYVSYELEDLPAESVQLAYYDFNGDLKATDAPPATNDGTASVDGFAGRAREFRNNNSVVLPDELGEEITTAAGSVSLWFKTTQSDVGMLFYGSQTGGNGFGGQNEFHINTQGNDIELFLKGVSNDIRLRGADADGDVTDGDWHQVTATWNIGGEVRLYIDGVLRDSTNHNGVLFDLGGTLKLGEPAANGQRNYQGELDELRLYARALTSAEVSERFRPAGPYRLEAEDFQSDAAWQLGTSGGTTFLEVPNGSPAGGGEDAAPRIAIEFEAREGSYEFIVEADTNGSGADNSFYYRLNGGAWITQSLPAGTSGFSLTSLGFLNLLDGTNVLEIAQREDGLKLDGFEFV